MDKVMTAFTFSMELKFLGAHGWGLKIGGHIFLKVRFFSIYVD